MLSQRDGSARRFNPRPYILASTCGILAALPWYRPWLFPVTWIALSVWIALTPNAPRVASGLWLVGGIAFMTTSLHWLPESVVLRLGTSFWGGTVVTAILILFESLHFGLCGFLVAWLRPRGGLGTLAWPVIWVALEFVWPQVFPWRIGQTQLGWLSLCQLAELTGVYSVSFLLIWTSAAMAVWLRERQNPQRTPSSAGWTPLVPIVVVAFASAWGSWRICDIERSVADRPCLRVGLVQPGSFDNKMLDILRAQSRSIASDVDLVVWGEGTIGEFALSQRSFREIPLSVDESCSPVSCDSPCPGLGRPLLCGGASFALESGYRGPLRNSAYLVDADEIILNRYHKRVLMPWCEYAWGETWIPGLRRLLGESGDFVPGTSSAPLILPDRGSLGVLICYEDLTADPARQTVLDGGQVLVNLNNLSSFGDTPAAIQHLQLAAFRAIENRRWLMRCGTTGSTALITATGRVECQAPLHEPSVLVASVPLLEDHSIYTRWGDWFAKGCLLLTTLWCLRSKTYH